MSKPTYRASAVIAEIDEWYNESLKSVYGCEPIEKEKIKIISDGETAKLFIDGKKCRVKMLNYISVPMQEKNQ